MKPIAWSCWNEDMPSAVILFTEPDKYEWQSIKPLYTTPQTKPLSDEEIWKIYSVTGLGKGMAVRFARAIEKRHGIK